MIKAIIFDCFGVLTTDKWKEFAATLPDEQREQARAFNRAYGAGHLDKDEFLQAIYELSGQRPGYTEDRFNSDTTKNFDLLNYIAQLKQTHKIGLLSNVGSNWICDYFLTTEEQTLFDSFVFSYKVGITKPDPRIFALAAERLHEPLENCVMVDDIESYCQAAKELGMQAVTYQNFQQTKTDLERLLADTKG